jgi:hypothetical protein
LDGENLGELGTVSVVVDGKSLGTLKDDAGAFPLPLADKQLPANPPIIQLTSGDEGTWFAPEHASLQVTLADGKSYCVARWTPNDPTSAAEGINSTLVPLLWRPVEEVAKPAAHFDQRDTDTGGAWKSKFGGQAVWMPNRSAPSSQNGYRLRPIDGSSFTWQNPTNDPRALELPGEKQSPRVASCWFDRKCVSFEIAPPENKPYRLTAFLLDFDHDHRATDAKILDVTGTPLDLQAVSREETDRGVYLTWTLCGKVRLVFNRTSGTNVSVSGIFIDAARPLRSIQE